MKKQQRLHKNIEHLSPKGAKNIKNA